ncbi:PREDICTED: TP53-regulating kinase [Dinoponera quadriceps]|uniref:non-specific serine/threonine protein kinase n=1 Tax=Dinoponera quadriceps TaxID=609295 RepID=A0A6P3XY07_DINQU|nr:PREDICTED: TP53-regulating kinase [Dinoponera quadriceps]XP_014483449.1 PREDICTED: TP53-regulating kinase [Dinoponera quadriceps]XP_014483450.1 PREDICTED: TP53-regulating kinase [Dinoponera quadriceps]XP_014483451.1 PREDICTED: TP53-regulating kinase [Dinoponera quadriceps]XP_014483452.1 PREDICTED: TP53-regulating kinase [Dinoponera quadriceps]XP_014483453.1 PREDICTED: TP53-regulating kinase [Dinoponera quadriceps]XP_014483454.1 PREDICTED: TP53-regulating kinase [Dinoponera quadriceps]XP_0
MTEGMELIAQGAEARLYKGEYLGKMCLLKERFVKNYRHPELDARLTKDRIKAEARAIIRAKAAGVATPALYLVDLERRSIYMEFVENAMVLKDFIDENISGKGNVHDLLEFIGRGLGALIAKLHSKHIIHGDLTTSNILLKNDSIELSDSKKSEADTKFVMIDFGLARVDSTAEDKSVDLYVLERSLLSAHSEVQSLFDRIFRHYRLHYQNKSQCEQVISKYKQVQTRGRKRLMIG